MNVSKREQRVLHALAQGGAVLLERDEDRRIIEVSCVTRDGWSLVDVDVGLFKRLKGRRLIASRNGGPYRITRLGLGVVRAQLDNR